MGTERTIIRGFSLEIEADYKAHQERGALFSPDERYRYVLWRTWGPSERRLVVIGLNPSTANATEDDPTIRRCIGFAKREGCDGLVMLNLFALRAMDPKVMRAHVAPIGTENDTYLKGHARGNDRVVVAAWGAHGSHANRAAAVLKLLPPTLCFGVTKDGHPKHPLYLRADSPLVPFPPVPVQGEPNG